MVEDTIQMTETLWSASSLPLEMLQTAVLSWHQEQARSQTLPVTTRQFFNKYRWIIKYSQHRVWEIIITYFNCPAFISYSGGCTPVVVQKFDNHFPPFSWFTYSKRRCGFRLSVWQYVKEIIMHTSKRIANYVYRKITVTYRFPLHSLLNDE